MADVDMKPVEEKDKKVDEKTEAEEKKEQKKPPPTVPEEIKANAALIERAVSTLEPRFTLRVLRTLTALRKRLNNRNIVEAVEGVYPPSRSLLPMMRGLSLMVLQRHKPSRSCSHGCHL